MLVQIVSLLAAASLASAQSSTVTPAPTVSGNPNGASYIGVLPEKAGSTLRGSISAASAGDGVGVKFSVSLSGLPASGGPFMYHIHEKPVPADGNCTATGAHLDPYKRGDLTPCDASMPETCQTGDLSGKHGTISTGEWSGEYVDAYLATRSDDPSFFGNLSFVVHLANKTRIGCANFSQLAPGEGVKPYPSSAALPLSTGAPTYNSSAPSSPTATGGYTAAPSSSGPAEFTGGATKMVAGPAALIAVVAAMLL